MNVLLIGSGGREHALAWKLRQSPRLAKLFVAPGNPGTAALGENVLLDTGDAAAVAQFCRLMDVALVVVGPELPLVRGLADRLRAENIAVFGPSAAAARLEGSKSFTKEVCDARDIPTAKWECFNNAPKAKMAARRMGSCVVKEDGLAAGKGVTVCDDAADAMEAIDDAFEGGAAAIVLEERLEGPEVSMFFVCDGETALPFGTAQDHKRAFDGDRGPNTGGMGAFSPSPLATDEVQTQVLERIVQPTLDEMRAREKPFTGVLYAGLMLTRDGPKLIEYNVRFGDPECQVLMMRLDTDLLDVLEAAADGRLAEAEPEWSDSHALTVVMASEGYPGRYGKGAPIRLPETDDATIFHAGTATKNGELVASGGRVLNVTAMAGSMEEARAKAYRAVGAVEWDGAFWRSDIGG